MANQERKNYIKAQKEMAHHKIVDYKAKKFEEARREQETKMSDEKKKVKDYEMEAQQLEMMEAELLRKLQETQAKERQAFTQLESAMIDASLPKKMRATGYGTGGSEQNQSHYSTRSGNVNGEANNNNATDKQ